MDEPEKSFKCQDKLCFDTKKQAETAALVAKYQHGIKLKTYYCRECNLWHLASDYDKD